MNRSLRMAATGAAAVLAALIAATSPALASQVADGTSNTLVFGVTSATLDQQHHRLIVTAPAPAPLPAGKRLASAEIVTPRLTIVLTDILIENMGETSSSLALNFTNVTYVGGSLTAGELILYNGHAGLGAVTFNVPDVTVIPN